MSKRMVWEKNLALLIELPELTITTLTKCDTASIKIQITTTAPKLLSILFTQVNN